MGWLFSWENTKYWALTKKLLFAFDRKALKQFFGLKNY